MWGISNERINFASYDEERDMITANIKQRRFSSKNKFCCFLSSWWFFDFFLLASDLREVRKKMKGRHNNNIKSRRETLSQYLRFQSHDAIFMHTRWCHFLLMRCRSVNSRHSFGVRASFQFPHEQWHPKVSFIWIWHNRG